MIFQEPMTSLNPVYSIRSAADRSGGASGSDESDKGPARRRAVELLDRVGIPDPASRHASVTRTRCRAVNASA